MTFAQYHVTGIRSNFCTALALIAIDNH